MKLSVPSIVMALGISRLLWAAPAPTNSQVLVSVLGSTALKKLIAKDPAHLGKTQLLSVNVERGGIGSSTKYILAMEYEGLGAEQSINCTFDAIVTCRGRCTSSAEKIPAPVFTTVECSEKELEADHVSASSDRSSWP